MMNQIRLFCGIVSVKKNREASKTHFKIYVSKYETLVWSKQASLPSLVATRSEAENPDNKLLFM
jgi:hypothetical protein